MVTCKNAKTITNGQYYEVNLGIASFKSIYPNILKSNKVRETLLINVKVNLKWSHVPGFYIFVINSTNG